MSWVRHWRGYIYIINLLNFWRYIYCISTFEIIPGNEKFEMRNCGLVSSTFERGSWKRLHSKSELAKMVLFASSNTINFSSFILQQIYYDDLCIWAKCSRGNCRSSSNIVSIHFKKCMTRNRYFPEFFPFVYCSFCNLLIFSCFSSIF